MNFILKSILVAFTVFVFPQIVDAQAKQNPDSLLKKYQELAKSNKPEDIKVITSAFKSFSNGKSENDLDIAIRMSYLIEKYDEGDSLTKLAITRFPKGKYARIDGYKKLVSSEGGSGLKVKMYNDWLARFPKPKGNSDETGDYAKAEVGLSFASENKAKDALYWINSIADNSSRGGILIYGGQLLMEKGDVVNAEAFIKAGLALTKANLKFSENPYAKEDYYANVSKYSSLLYSTGKYDEALKYSKIAYDSVETKSPITVQNYAFALTANKKGKEALPLLSSLASSQITDSAFKKVFLDAYVQDKSTEAGFIALTDSLANMYQNKFEEDIAKSIVSEPAPDFSLKDLDGNTVSLASLKGKVVVLDFWATWCGPCKRSFPAMKKAQEKFQADSGVKFLFIDTWENTEDPGEMVKEFISSNNYPFHVLLDSKATGVVKKFGVNGIPAKFIIDGEGKIRFRLTGFNGSDDFAVKELSLMIEMARS